MSAEKQASQVIHQFDSGKEATPDFLRDATDRQDSEDRGKTKILIINTGGRGGKRVDDATGEAVPGYFQSILHTMDDLRKPSMPLYSVVDCPKLNHSSDVGPAEWSLLAGIIESHYFGYHGYVVIHGTDTMAYTATALSFMLLNLGKPVIFTGSLIPVDKVHTDLKRNLILSLLFASSENICEVCVVFAERLFRANRTTKVSSVMLQPFASPNLAPLAYMRGKTVKLESSRLRKAPKGRLIVQKNMSAKVLTFKLVPGVQRDPLIQLVRRTDAKAIVVAAFGTGNCPIRGGAIIEMAKLAHERGIIVAICSQVRFGNVELASYEAGRQLLDHSVVGVEDMTLEATVVKLKYLLGIGLNPQQVQHMLVQDLRGEISTAPVSKI